MSTLLIDELFTGVNFDQVIRIDRDTNLVYVRPWVYLHGTLANGDFQLEVLDGATVLKTIQIPHTEINAAKTETYAHGFIRFDVEPLALNIPEGQTNKEYTLRFSMQNYTNDTNNFLGISRRWDIKVYDIYGAGVANNQAPNDFVEPAGLEIYEYRTT